MFFGARRLATALPSLTLGASIIAGGLGCPLDWSKNGEDAGWRDSATDSMQPDASADDGGTLTGGDAEQASIVPREGGLELPTDAGENRNACDPNPCGHAGTCSQTSFGASCACQMGFEGDRCELDADECVTANLCDDDYPCQQTAAPGYTCVGHFADWHMPDSVSGSKFGSSFDTSTEGVVIDQITGLIWERAWYSNTRTWHEAKAYCSSLGLAGYDDWRLPSKIELESLLDETRSGPALDTEAFPGTLPRAVYWSSSSHVELPEGQSAWVLSLELGLSTYGPTGSKASVRCVRGPSNASPGTPETRYEVDAAQDTVKDSRTSLVWQRTLSSNSYDWPGAKTYCAARGEGWRLPALKELLTLVDPTRINPTIASAFPGTPAEAFWSASSSAGDPSYAWYVSFYNGYSDGSLKSGAEKVRCVR